MADAEQKTMFWKFWARNAEWRDKLAKRAAYRSLDMPEDDMQINNTRVGVGTAGLVGIAAAAGLPGLVAAGLMGGMLLRSPAEDAKPQAGADAKPQAVEVSDSEYEVRFYDRAGNPIDIQPYAPQ